MEGLFETLEKSKDKETVANFMPDEQQMLEYLQDIQSEYHVHHVSGRGRGEDGGYGQAGVITLRHEVISSRGHSGLETQGGAELS